MKIDNDGRQSTSFLKESLALLFKETKQQSFVPENI